MGAMNEGVRTLDRLIVAALGPSAALAERQAFTAQVHRALTALGLARMVGSVVSARRGEGRGTAQGWALVITVNSHAAMTKLRLLGPSLLSQLQQEISALSSVSVTTQRSVQPAVRTEAGPRPAPPPAALARLRAFYSQDH
jgi:hypothetical protein